jgi:RNase P subunit RPR2
MGFDYCPKCNEQLWPIAVTRHSGDAPGEVTVVKECPKCLERSEFKTKP